MAIPIANATRQQIRQAIGDNIGAVIISTASTTGTPTTLQDSYALANGGQDNYVGWQIMVNSSGTVAADYAKRYVTASSAAVLTLSAALAATTVSGNAYELWRPPFTIEQINNLIAQAERDVTTQVFVDKIDETTYTQIGEYRYAIPTGFVAIHTVEYVRNEKEWTPIDDTSSVWNESSAGTAKVVVTVDNKLRDGENWMKFAITAAATVNDVLATQKITQLPCDLRDSDTVELSVYSTVALTAGDMQLLLSGTASCATPSETLNLPVIAANTFTRFPLTLASPQNDGAIISIGLKQVVDKAACNIFLHNIRAVRSDSRRFVPLFHQQWNIVSGSTDYLRLTFEGKQTTRDDTLLRIRGYQAIAAMTAETSTSQVDPQYLVDRISSDILLSHQAIRSDLRETGKIMAARADRKKIKISTNLFAGSRFI